MESPPHGPEPCASANSAISALATFSLFLTQSARSGSGAYFAAAFFTEVTGPEPCASANSAISALATRLRTSESMILFFDVGVKAFFASFRASFASLIAFQLPE